MIAKPNGLLLILLIILLTHSISYFLQKNVSDFCFVRLSSFFAHNLFTNFQYHKTIKNNNRFLIDFFHTFLSFETGFMSVSFLSIRLKRITQTPLQTTFYSTQGAEAIPQYRPLLLIWNFDSNLCAASLFRIA